MRLLVTVLAATPVWFAAPVPAANAAAAAFTNSDIASISAGYSHTCVVKGVGPAAAVYCWGSNSSGQLGDGTTTDRNTPVPVADNGGFTNDNIVAVAAGGLHTCALRSESASSKLYCWGANTRGQLGDGTTTQRLTPVPVSNNAPYTNSGNTSLSLGGSHTCVTRVGGGDIEVLYCWGYGQNGRVGDGDTNNHDVLLPLKVVDNGAFTNTLIKEVSLGSQHTCARKSNVVYCWGVNSPGGRLGDGTLTERTSAVAVAGTAGGAATDNTDYREISSGEEHTCAIRDVGASASLYCWGRNDEGQLGLNNTTDVSVSALVNQGDRGSTGAMSVDNPPVLARRTVGTGSKHTCAIQGSGNPGVVFCWGDNFRGQLGDTTTTDRLTPKQVSAGAMGTNTSIKSVAAGGSHTCVIKGGAMTGVVYCWGLNFNGQVGDGTNGFANSRNTPVLVVGGAAPPTTGPTSGSSSTTSASGPSLYWASLDTNGGTCRIDEVPVSTSVRTPFLGFRYIPTADECTKDGYAFSGWAKKTEPGAVLRLPRLIDMNGNTWRYFIADHYDLIAVWVSPGGTASFRT